MNKAEVMRLVKRGPHKTSCWAWRGMLAPGGIPTVVKGKYEDPGLILGAPSVPRRCRNKLCVNPAHREGAQEKPLLPPAPKPHPKPNTKAKTLKLVSKQTEAAKAKAQTPPAPPAASHTPKPEPKVTPKPETKTKAKLKPRKSTTAKESTQCNNGHPKTPENTWTSPSTGKSKCKPCEKESKARSKAKKAAKK